MGRTEDGNYPFHCDTRLLSHLVIHADFHELFKMFMDRSLERLRSVAGYPDVTIWTSSLTTEKYIDDLRTEDYTIQGDLILLISRYETFHFNSNHNGGS